MHFIRDEVAVAELGLDSYWVRDCRQEGQFDRSI